MRNLSCSKIKWDKKYFFAFIITLICAIICGIVLYKPVISNEYFIDFALDYVFNVFNFKNSALLFTHILSDLIYLYIIFLICGFTKLKYLTLALIFFRGLFFGVYSAVLIGVNSFGGVVVAVFVFIPSTLASILLCFLMAELANKLNNKFAPFAPAAFAVADLVLYALLINVLFRIVVAIV